MKYTVSPVSGVSTVTCIKPFLTYLPVAVFKCVTLFILYYYLLYTYEEMAEIGGENKFLKRVYIFRIINGFTWLIGGQINILKIFNKAVNVSTIYIFINERSSGVGNVTPNI